MSKGTSLGFVILGVLVVSGTLGYELAFVPYQKAEEKRRYDREMQRLNTEAFQKESDRKAAAYNSRVVRAKQKQEQYQPPAPTTQQQIVQQQYSPPPVPDCERNNTGDYCFVNHSDRAIRIQIYKEGNQFGKSKVIDVPARDRACALGIPVGDMKFMAVDPQNNGNNQGAAGIVHPFRGDIRVSRCGTGEVTVKLPNTEPQVSNSYPAGYRPWKQ
jgi:hypothetical protein